MGDEPTPEAEPEASPEEDPAPTLRCFYIFDGETTHSITLPEGLITDDR